ncbi:hypothetical protein [uncultured Dokdonia sp.]|uniref:hypothetical protein n=1 Tax=uncultured Dokdonia sp. TaxID=575653 RepID=UPI00260B3A81|nr:hypothetical protein [uncultured Dokdonia sp.]
MFKKYITIIAFVSIYSCTTDDPDTIQEPVANIFNGDAELFTQQAVDDFGAMEYTEITGNLILRSQFENPDPISSLSSLSTIEVVGGDLRLSGLFDVPSLDGLQNLTSVSGVLALIVNSTITSLDAFSNINSTIQSLEIINFREIQSLQGLENISIASGGDLIIEGNDKLASLDAIQNGIPSMMGTIKFQEFILDCGPFIDCGPTPPEPQPFTSLAFLSNVNEVDWLRLKGFQGSNLIGLENITAVNRLSVWVNPNLTNLQELSAVNNNVLFLFVAENNQLENLEGLENIPLVTAGFQAIANPVLTDFCSVQNSITILLGEDVEILFNAYNPTQQDIIDGNCSE